MNDDDNKPLPERFSEPFKVYIGEDLVSDPYSDSKEEKEKLDRKWAELLGKAHLKRAQDSKQRKE
jgi:hypothetical protein